LVPFLVDLNIHFSFISVTVNRESDHGPPFDLAFATIIISAFIAITVALFTPRSITVTVPIACPVRLAPATCSVTTVPFAAAFAVSIVVVSEHSLLAA